MHPLWSRDALRILRLLSQEVRVDEAIAVLQSRFTFLEDASQKTMAKGVETLRDLGSEEVPSRMLRSLLEPSWDGESPSPWVMLQGLGSGRPLHRQKHLPSDWVALFAQILDAWGWPGKASLDSLEYQQLQNNR